MVHVLVEVNFSISLVGLVLVFVEFHTLISVFLVISGWGVGLDRVVFVVMRVVTFLKIVVLNLHTN